MTPGCGRRCPSPRPSCRGPAPRPPDPPRRDARRDPDRDEAPRDHRVPTSSCAPAPESALGGHPPRAAGRPHRPRRTQRRGQDDVAARPRRESQPYGGTIRSTGPVGYLPQDPREGDLSVLAKDRVLSARGLDQLLRDMEKSQSAMAELADGDEHDKAVAATAASRTRFAALGGYAAESEAGADLLQPRPARPRARPAPRDALRRAAPPCRARPDPLRRVRRGRPRRDHAAARRADQPPRRRLDLLAARVPQAHEGGLVVISHDTDLLAAVVNKVWFLDATRGEARRLQHGLEELPRARADDETPAPPGARQRREEGRRR